MDRKDADRHKSAADAKSSSSSKDIWMMLSAMEPAARKDAQAQPADIASGVPAGAQDERDTFTLIIGSKNAGKTSLTANFRNSSKVEEIKPTTALDYVFVRLKVPSGSSTRAPVAHMWELATAKCVSEMIRVPLAPERILNGALVIVVDLSVPGDAVPYLVQWLTTLYKVVQEVLKLKEKNPVEKFAVDKLRQEAMQRYGNAHPDKDEVTPIPLPLIIIGNKYDTFRDEDSVKRKGVLQAMRALAHMYGASLLFTSMKDKNLVTQFRTVMKGFAFRSSSSSIAAKSSKEVDPAKPVFVPAGADLFEDIGLPKTARQREFTKDQHEERAKQWRKIVTEYYAPSGEVPESLCDDEIDAKEQEDSKDKFPEPSIDRNRQRKSEELRRYRDQRKKATDKKSKAA